MTAIPAGAKKPTDRKPPAKKVAAKKSAAAPAKAEAQAANVIIEHDGLTYEIDRFNADNLELMEDIEDENYIKAVRGYLGADQWSKFKESHRDEKGRVPSSAFQPFLQAVIDGIGGNS